MAEHRRQTADAQRPCSFGRARDRVHQCQAVPETTASNARPATAAQGAQFDDAAFGGTPVRVRCGPVGLVQVIDFGSGPLMGA